MWRFPDAISALLFASILMLVSGCDMAALTYIELFIIPTISDSVSHLSRACKAEHSVFFDGIRSTLQQYGLYAAVVYALVVVAGCTYFSRYLAFARRARQFAGADRLLANSAATTSQRDAGPLECMLPQAELVACGSINSKPLAERSRDDTFDVRVEARVR